MWCTLFATATLVAQVSSLALEVATTGGNASSPILYGFMFEDINHSGDGGIYAELLQNNGFQGTDPNLTAWEAVGNVTIAMDTAVPLSTAITKSLRVDVPSDTTGSVGVSNTGYFGIPMPATTMTAAGFIQGDFSGNLTLSVVSAADGTVFGSTDLAVESNSTAFTPFTTTFTTTAAPDGNNVFDVTFDAATIAGSSLWFDLLQLFPVTFKNRANGLRPDIAQALANVNGSFLRLPGGNNLEGATVDDRWKWNETIGPLEDRPGREGDWTYPNTDGLGLLEYMYWCQDMGLVPVLGVWDGLTLGGGVISDITELQPYIDDVMNELEYLMGDTSTTFGALRAADGQEEPFTLQAVEVGNEDFLNDGTASYAARLTAFYDAITAVYPNLTIIASTNEGLPNPIPEGLWEDIHFYVSPDDFVSMFDMFDNSDRSHGIFVGEYAARTTNDGTVVTFPELQGTVGEAVFMIGMERNSDVVKMAAYAPLLQNINSTQWTPDLITFSSTYDDITLSTSYYNQQMFSVNRGSTILPVTSDSDFGPLYWVASSADDGTFFVKLANYGDTTDTLELTIDGATSGTATTLTGDTTAMNTPEDKTAVVPVVTDVAGTDGVFNVTLPAWSVVIVAVS